MFHSVVYSDLKASQIGKHCVSTAYALHHLPVSNLHVLEMSSDALLIKRQTKKYGSTIFIPFNVLFCSWLFYQINRNLLFTIGYL